MPTADLNLLRVLDVLLQENSVTVAAERLGTTAPAVSRSLARLRRISGDPLLVRAGQAMVPTARAEQIRDRVGDLLREADRLLRPGADLDPSQLARTFTLQAADLITTTVAVALLERVHAQAPGVNVVFRPEALEDGGALRTGDVDLEVGVLGDLDPETRHRSLTTTSLRAVVRTGHPLTVGEVDPARFAAADHIGISRRGRRRGPIDDALSALGLSRRVAVVVPSHTTAMLLARRTDLVGLTAAEGFAETAAELGVATFAIPLELPAVRIGMAWHPRHDGDPAHRWFRDLVGDVVGDVFGAVSGGVSGDGRLSPPR